MKETQDPLLDQILSPVPQGDPAQEQQMQIDQAMGEDQMRRGGQKKAKRKYRNLIERTNKLLGVEGAYPSDFGDIPMNTYDKSYPFMQQSFETIDIPTLEKYFSDLANAPTIQQDQPLMPMIDVYETGFFGRPKKYRILYPQASKGTAEQQAEEALTKAGLGDRINHFPGELSGGEQQRVALARAFVVKPALLLADEPTGNLDRETGQIVMNLLFDLQQEHGTTLVLVTHDEILASRCERSVRMIDGCLREENGAGS